MKKGDWFRLKAGNDWGETYYSRSPKLRRSCWTHTPNGHRGPGFYETASRKRAYRLDSGESIRVKMHDGSERDGYVAIERSVCSVSDHGRSYDVGSDVPYVEFDDGTHISLLRVAIQYDPERDPTADEIETDAEREAIKRALDEGDAVAAKKKAEARAKLTDEERKLLGVK